MARHLANRVVGLPGFPASIDIRTSAIDRYARAHDASHYLLVPQAVATPHCTEDVARLLAASRQTRTPLTFRSGGTSLSGQSVSDQLLVDTRHHFRQLSVAEEGRLLIAGPGVTVNRANAELARYGRKLGPDPASEVACTIGGVVANNSSGMTCGTHANTYATLDSLLMVLPSGTVLDTARPDADAELRAREPQLHQGLLELRRRVLDSPAAVATIRERFAMKNTIGYGINAFVDHETPARVLEHLLIGSEGTLGFVAEARFRTVPVMKHVATALLVFDSLAAATAALPALVSDGLDVIELMDTASLRVAQTLAGTPAAIAALKVEAQTALLVEHHAETALELEHRVASLTRLARTLPLSVPFEITSQASERAKLWKVRKGLYTSVAGSRPSGTTALLEDIVVPVEHLLPTCERLTGLFDQHGYDSSVIFGHAKDGNIHFLVNERFTDPQGVARLEAFTQDMAELVLDQGGNLKAEHGTGRIMAPYVERQYGTELYQLMRDLKTLVDPDWLLNPGVVLPAPGAAEDLKVPVAVEQEVDRCVECGYCEPSCPSKDLTLTPRQRIAVRRDIAAARAAGETALVAELERDYAYAGVDTCAVDGLCGLACPMSINTADLVRRLRAEDANVVERTLWEQAAASWGTITRAGSVALTVADKVPASLVRGVTDVGRAVLGTDTVPRYHAGLPGGGKRRRPGVVGTGPVLGVFFPACIDVMFGPEEGSAGTFQALAALCERAGVALYVPGAIEGLCCGTPWKSKGYRDGYEVMSQRVMDTVWHHSEQGRVPVVCDASSCTEGLQVMAARRHPEIRFVDAPTFVREHLLDKLRVTHRIGSVVIHPTCSTTHLGSTDDVVALCRAVADEVHVPRDWGCCAFAGDRGMLHPELTASATARETAEVTSRRFDAYISSNRTCEIGLSRATGKAYRNVLELLEAATR